MISLRSILNESGTGSLRQFFVSTGADDPSTRSQVARWHIARFWRENGGVGGKLGLSLGDARSSPDGAERPFAGGMVQFLNRIPGVKGPGTVWSVQVDLLGFRSIEESNEWSAADEPYFLISVVGTTGSATVKVGPVENVDAGEEHTIVTNVCRFKSGILPPILLAWIHR